MRSDQFKSKLERLEEPKDPAATSVKVRFPEGDQYGTWPRTLDVTGVRVETHADGSQTLWVDAD